MSGVLDEISNQYFQLTHAEKRVADYIIENAVVESDSDNSAEVYRNTVELLKPYLHTLKLDSIKAEIKHRFDKAEILTECLGYCVLKHSFTLFI